MKISLTISGKDINQTISVEISGGNSRTPLTDCSIECYARSKIPVAGINKKMESSGKRAGKDIGQSVVVPVAQFKHGPISHIHG